METTGNYYIYVFLDVTKPGKYEYGELSFDYRPFYIGVSNTDTYYVREEVHIKYARLKKDVCNNKYKMNIINRMLKKGMEPKSVRIYENLSSDRAFELEKELIKKIGTKHEGKGPLVNIAEGGFGGDTFTNNPRKEEIREKHRQNALGTNNNMYGLPLEKRPSHIAKINGNHWNIGRKASAETKKKFSSLRAGHLNPKSRRVCLLDDNFQLINIFDCIKYAAEFVGASRGSATISVSKNSKGDLPYHTTKDHYFIYESDWESRFKDIQDQLRIDLKKVKRYKNQYTTKK